jgi:hypothetical protein
MSFLHLPGARRPVAAATLACLALAGVGAAAPAAAAQPEIQKSPPGEISVLSEGSCPFPVREDVLARQLTTKVFVDAEGVPRVIMGSGALSGTLTHVLPDGSDGPSIQINFSGPGKIDPASGVVTAVGPWLVESADDASTPAFEGFMVLVRGRATISTDPVTGAALVTSAGGNVTDLCAALG